MIIEAMQDDDKPSTTDVLIVAGLRVADRSLLPARSWREEAAAGGLQPCGRHGNSSRPQPAPSATWGTRARFIVVSDAVPTDDALEGASVLLAAGSQFWRRRGTW